MQETSTHKGKTRARIMKKKLYEKREFDPSQPNKKPFFDTKRKVYVIPKPRSGVPASGMPASGMEASGIPAVGENKLNIKKKWDNLYRPPEDVEDQNSLADRLLEWAKCEDSRNIKVFFIHQGINPYRAGKLAETNEYFASCLQMAKVLIGARMTEAAQTRKEDGNVNMKLLPMYDEEYKQLVDQQRQAEASKTAVINLIADGVPDSPLVPKLVKRDE